MPDIMLDFLHTLEPCVCTRSEHCSWENWDSKAQSPPCFECRSLNEDEH